MDIREKIQAKEREVSKHFQTGLKHFAAKDNAEARKEFLTAAGLCLEVSKYYDDAGFPCSGSFYLGKGKSISEALSVLD